MKSLGSRIAINIILLILFLFAPWRIAFGAFAFAIIFFHHFIEAMIFALIFDSLFGYSQANIFLPNFYFETTFFVAIYLLLVEFIKPYIYKP